MSDFNVGDVVVCVGPFDPDDGQRGMFKNSLYRVAAIVPAKCGTPTLNFDGISPAPFTGWRFECFRKLDAPKTEIADRIRACRPVGPKVPA